MNAPVNRSINCNILCVSDQIDPLVYSAAIKNRYGKADLVLCAGDLPLEYLDFIVSSLNLPLLFIFGNHHLESYERYKRPHKNRPWDSGTSGLTYIGARMWKEGQLLVGGLDGSMRYNSGINQYTETQMFFEICKLIPRMMLNRIIHGRFIDILLTHAAPRGIHDKSDPCHLGFKCFLWFMNVFKPRYLIHGHIHLYDLGDVRSSVYKNTVVINAYGHMAIGPFNREVKNDG
ncbi:MAG: metallophosphoesterase [Treponema sp.]|jgi:hypothetical protein|nr:metallophosphoesterase [Treponema sp.]